MYILCRHKAVQGDRCEAGKQTYKYMLEKQTNRRTYCRQTYVHVADMERGVVGDMREAGVFESLRVKKAMLISAAEAAEMILRVDDIIKVTHAFFIIIDTQQLF